ncbi:MAG: ATP-binding protein [Brevinematales bacterium]|nr:ATP-binding protein [Brevinematales bacterium]
MIDKTYALPSRIENILYISSAISTFTDIAIVDVERKVIYLKNTSQISNQDMISIHKRTIEEYNIFKIPFLFGSHNNTKFLSYYFRTKDSELTLIGFSENELEIQDIATFKLIAINIKELFEIIETTATIIEKLTELESIISFYKSITTPLNRELFLAYILDKIISELGAEVGSIMILDKDKNISSLFQLGLEEETTKNIFYKIRKEHEIDKITIITPKEIPNLIPNNSKRLENLILYPIKFENEVVGVIMLANKRVGINYIPFQDQDIHKLNVLITPVGIIIKNYIMFRDLFIFNQLNQKILSNITSIIALTDPNYKVKYINRENSKETIEKLIEKAKEEDNQILSSRGIEIEINGNFYEVKAQPIFEESGNLTEILWTIEDITYKKEQINRHILSEKINIIGELVSGIAHEIRNPLTSIGGFVELLKTRKNDQDFINKFINIISKDIGRITNLLNSFIRFSKPVSYEITDVDIKSVISETLDILMYQITQKNIKIINKLEDEIIIKGNYNLLLQVFTNIILNSIQAITHNKGKIEIGYMNYSDETNSYIVIYIKDNGIGIPKEIQNKIFDPFFTTKPDGTGLGLSICQKIVMDLGGFVKVKSDEELGTNMMVFLPYRKTKQLS